MFAVRAISGNRAVIVQLFNAPGTYQPLYGRTVFQLEGQGSPGNSGYEDLIGTTELIQLNGLQLPPTFDILRPTNLEIQHL